MDDLWGNAWNEPVKTETTEVKKGHAEDSWSSSNTNADLNVPSWTTNTARWDDHSVSTSSTWVGSAFSSSIDDGWGASTLEGVNETQEPEEVAPTPLKSPTLGPSMAEGDLKEAEATTGSPPESPVVQTAAHESISTPIPPSPGRLDTFSQNQSITVATPNEWAPAVTSPVATDTDWSSPWGGAVAEPELQSRMTTAKQPEGPVDDWERAAQEKKLRDTKMPPELMSSIMAYFEELSSQLWPGMDLASVRGHAAPRSEWEGGLENIEGFSALLNHTIPVQMSPPPPIQFSRTKVSAAYLRSLRVTKSAPIMLNSPLSHLSKDSAAWERTVKAQKDLDGYMVGWTPGAIEEESTPTPTEKKGIFSFFSRKSTTGPEVGIPASYTASNSASPVVADLSAVAKNSPRVSVPPSPAFPPPGFEPTPSLISVAAPSADTSFPVSSPALEPAPTSSAVSRFLGRWSRAKTHSPHSSISLDPGDLTFLENVPSYHDDDDENLEGLQAALKAVNTDILPPTQSVEQMSKDEFDRMLEAQAAVAFDEKLLDDFFFGEFTDNHLGRRYKPLGAKKKDIPRGPSKQTTITPATKTADPFSSSKRSDLVNDDFSSFMSTSPYAKPGPAAMAQPLGNTSHAPIAPLSIHGPRSTTLSNSHLTGLAGLNDSGSLTAPALPPKPATPPILSPRLPNSPTPTGSPLLRGAIPPHKAVSLTPQSTGGTTRPSPMLMPIAPLLPPPPGMRPISRGPAVDLLGGHAPPQNPQSPTPASDLAVLMGFETPSNGSAEPSRVISPSLVPFSQVPTTVRPSEAAPKSKSTAQAGGLSAQDLSFFEGL